jgi:hypothetical protein
MGIRQWKMFSIFLLITYSDMIAYFNSVQARLAPLRELQSQTGEELDALLPSVLDKALKSGL